MTLTVCISCAAGLGARDSLRLEAGLCLYGNDLTEDISPVEAGLAWCIGARVAAAALVRHVIVRLMRRLASGKRRREKFDFLGGSVVQKQLAEGATKRRIGLIIPAGAPARQHSKILDAAGKEVGEVTSGGFSPCLQKNIAMGACCRRCASCVRSHCAPRAVPGYVSTPLSKAGTPVKVEVRGKVNEAVVTKMPFVPTQYFKG